jgi:hypothetical protein
LRRAKKHKKIRKVLCKTSRKDPKNNLENISTWRTSSSKMYWKKEKENNTKLKGTPKTLM